MNYGIFYPQKREQIPAPSENQNENSPVVNNHLEALKLLSLSLLKEVEALNSNSKTQTEMLDEVKDGKIDLDKEVQKYEVELIRCALVRTGGRQRRAAKLLNVKISTLNAKIKRYGISTSGLEFALR
jgi:DNA-binding NtrC family response regulator